MKLKKNFHVKRQDFSPNFFWTLCFYGLDTEPEPEFELVERRNRNLSSRNRNNKNSYTEWQLTVAHLGFLISYQVTQVI